MSNVNFQTLAQLLEAGHTTGVLATAIEKHGVYGWDRYGRFRQFKSNEQPSGASGSAAPPIAATAVGSIRVPVAPTA